MMKLMTIIFGLFTVVSHVSAEISVVGTTDKWDSNGRNVRISTHADTKSGDLLLLAAHRTEGLLPANSFDGWTRRADCFKTRDSSNCRTVEDCARKEHGCDLAQVIFTRRATGSGENFKFDFGEGSVAWLILASLRGVDVNNPVRDWEGLGNDGSNQSNFPSIRVAKGDMVLLSQSFDNSVRKSLFKPPRGFKREGYVTGNDETAFLYAKVWDSGRTNTGRMKTRGDGQLADRDALISLSLIEGEGEDGETTCNFDKVKKKCSNDGCKNLVWIHRDHTCKNYCEHQNARCVGAWEDYANRCHDTSRATPRGWGCRSDYRSLGTSDAICQCVMD